MGKSTEPLAQPRSYNLSSIWRPVRRAATALVAASGRVAACCDRRMGSRHLGGAQTRSSLKYPSHNLQKPHFPLESGGEMGYTHFRLARKGEMTDYLREWLASNRSRHRVWVASRVKPEKLNSKDALKKHCLRAVSPPSVYLLKVLSGTYP